MGERFGRPDDHQPCATLAVVATHRDGHLVRLASASDWCWECAHLLNPTAGSRGDGHGRHVQNRVRQLDALARILGGCDRTSAVGLTRAQGVTKMRPKMVLYMVNMLHM